MARAEAEAEALAQAAERLIGVPFRLHGRDPAHGVDCIGLVYASLAAIGKRPVAPAGYRLRNISIAHWLGHAARNGLEPVSGPLERGDVLLVQPSPIQHHLLIAAGAHSAVHAHASLRKVVREPLGHNMVITAQWRLAPSLQG